jgi:hypothetical protein
MSESKEELLMWKELYIREVNDEKLSEQRRMYAFSRLTNIAAALKEIEEEEKESSDINTFNGDCIYNQRDYE